jgi:hypothetical protein
MTKNESPIRNKLLSACLHFLIPTARFLLRGGISCSEVLSLVRLAFVAAASKDYGDRGREANSSRIAAVTGLSRREVSRLKTELVDFHDDARTMLTPIGDLLHRWYTAKSYLSSDGMPLELPIEGSAPSLESLVSDVFTTDFPVRAMRSELIRAGLAKPTAGGGILPVSRHVVPEAVEERLLSALTYGLRAHAETIAFNSDPGRSQSSRIERFVEGPRLNKENREYARIRMRHLIAQYSTKIDDELSELAALQKESRETDRRVGVGFYYFED